MPGQVMSSVGYNVVLHNGRRADKEAGGNERWRETMTGGGQQTNVLQPPPKCLSHVLLTGYIHVNSPPFLPLSQLCLQYHKEIHKRAYKR